MTRDLLPDFTRAPTLAESLEMRRHLSSTTAAKTVIQRLQYILILHRQLGDHLPPPTSFNLPPLTYIDQVLCQVQEFFPTFAISLFLPGSGRKIWNQFELDRAYLDLAPDSDVLELEVVLSTPVPNEAQLRTEASFAACVAPRMYRSGPWSNGEKALFAYAVGLYGWGNWPKIAAAIGTRTVNDVQAFAATEGSSLT